MADSIKVELPENLEELLRKAVGEFWLIRKNQRSKQLKAEVQDQGSRSAATGGKQMGAIENLIVSLLIQNGIPQESIFVNSTLELPGYFRPTKMWDLLVIHEKKFLAAIELKSQVGPSFGNNFNNRTEEAIGSAKDIQTAFREKAFGNIRKPWLGYLFMLEESPKSTRPVKVKEPHFKVFEEFRDSSYAKRYEELCRRLVREGLYSEASLLLVERDDFKGKTLHLATNDLSFTGFIQALISSVLLGINRNKI